MKITKENYRDVLGKIISELKKGKIVYFDIACWELDCISSCQFTPVVLEGKNQYMFIDDYEKILVILLTHPKVKDLEFNEKEGCITADFEVPLEYLEDEWEEDIL